MSLKNRSAMKAAGASFRTKGMSNRVLNMITSPIKEMMWLASKMEDVCLMAQGIPAEDTPRHIKDAIIDAINGSVASKYSVLSGMQSCREAVCKRYKMRYGVDVDPDKNVGMTAGCMEACLIATLSVVNPGEEVIMISPCFASHMEQVMAAEGVPVFVNTDEKNNWLLDMNAVRKAITKKTKAIFITNPSNPTGALFPEKQVRELCRLALEHNLFIIADETYDFLTYDGQKLFSFIQVPEIRKNLLLVGSFSKEYCMTGYRLGWVITEDDILHHLFKIHDAATVCACVASQFGAIAAINGPQDSVRTLVKNMQARRDLICKRLDHVPHLFRYYSKPQGAYYILVEVKFPHKDSIDAAFQLQKALGVVTVPGIAFGPKGEHHLRFSFGGGASRGPKGSELINEAFDRMEKWGQQFK
ncbi:pyridoxal phosphate-dependent aminotransferase [Candidatus Peregrinibacteria bacterium]|nr:pyridoxal phosphate-dependent aminotransferase [Candidatus Peregrinibacteria bacterium]